MSAVLCLFILFFTTRAKPQMAKPNQTAEILRFFLIDDQQAHSYKRQQQNRNKTGPPTPLAKREAPGNDLAAARKRPALIWAPSSPADVKHVPPFTDARGIKDNVRGLRCQTKTKTASRGRAAGASRESCATKPVYLSDSSWVRFQFVGSK